MSSNARSEPKLGGLFSSLLACSLLVGCVVTPRGAVGDPPDGPAPPKPVLSEPEREEVHPNEPHEIAARHLLVAYRGAERAAPTMTRTRDEAKARATEALTRAKNGVDFVFLVKEYSDEPGAAERGGDLGRFERRTVVKPFADAAFALKPGEISDLVETSFGFHVIQRTE
jgi:peptidyl-prolyl cis-trans isomerase NIMA-interacting 1